MKLVLDDPDLSTVYVEELGDDPETEEVKEGMWRLAEKAYQTDREGLYAGLVAEKPSEIELHEDALFWIRIDGDTDDVLMAEIFGVETRS